MCGATRTTEPAPTSVRPRRSASSRAARDDVESWKCRCPARSPSAPGRGSSVTAAPRASESERNSPGTRCRRRRRRRRRRVRPNSLGVRSAGGGANPPGGGLGTGQARKTPAWTSRIRELHYRWLETPSETCRHRRGPEPRAASSSRPDRPAADGGRTGWSEDRPHPARRRAGRRDQGLRRPAARQPPGSVAGRLAITILTRRGPD